jgi:hypothetical protein
VPRTACRNEIGLLPPGGWNGERGGGVLGESDRCLDTDRDLEVVYHAQTMLAFPLAYLPSKGPQDMGGNEEGESWMLFTLLAGACGAEQSCQAQDALPDLRLAEGPHGPHGWSR